MVNQNSQSGNSNPSSSIAGALTYPTNENARALPRQPRQPTNLQGLLKFAMEATKAEDAPGNSNLGPMDEERRKFLEEALKNLTVDLAEVIRNALNILLNTDRILQIRREESIPDEVQYAYDSLLDYINDIDIANDFYKMGGFAIFPIAYSSENAQLRANASNLLAELCQNNPFCQDKAIETGLLNVLLNLVEIETGTAQAKCLYAISCICREHERACTDLIAQGGCHTLSVLLHNEDATAKTKAAFLIRYLCTHNPQAKEQFIKYNIINTISQCIRQGRDMSTEHMLSILIALTEAYNPVVIDQCHKSSLQQALQDHLNLPELQLDDSFIEEKQYCQTLLNYLRSHPGKIEVNEEADR